MKATIFCNIITKVTSVHLCHIMLVRSESWVLLTPDGRNKECEHQQVGCMEEVILISIWHSYPSGLSDGTRMLEYPC